jgi:polysaccharide biosynthesis protein PslA
MSQALLIAPETHVIAAGERRQRRSALPLLRWTHGFVNRMVMTSDVVTIMCMALLGSFTLLGMTPVLTQREALLTAAIASIAFVMSLNMLGGYRVERYARIWMPLRDILHALVPSGLVAVLPLWAFMPGILQHPGWLLAWGGCGFLGLVAERQVARLAVRLIERKTLLRRRVAIIGATQDADTLVRQMLDPAHEADYEIVGVFDDRADERRLVMIAGQPVTGSTADLIAYAQHHPVDLILVSLPWDKSMAIFRLIEQVQWISADIVVPFGSSGFRPHTARLFDVVGEPVLQLMHQPFKGSQALLKLIEDYTVALLGLLVASPIMLLAALAIRLDSPGPVFFRQARVGFNGRPFMIYKFRTMTVDPTDDGSVGTGKHNPRITSVGGFLRRTSIDEIPQLLNVLLGDMSIIGPRPHVSKMRVGDETYTEAVKWYAARHRIKPGITGWAQINGMRGGIHSVAKAARGVDLDLHYIKNWSLWLDIEIMFKTLIIGMVGYDVF